MSLNKIFESKNIYKVTCNTVLSIAKEGSKSCLCAGSSRARGSKAVRRGTAAVTMPPQSCYSFDLAAGAPLIVHSSCRRHCRRRHAKLLCLGGYESAAARHWRRQLSGAVVFALAIARAHKPGTGAERRHWCKAPQTPPLLPPRRTTLP